MIGWLVVFLAFHVVHGFPLNCRKYTVAGKRGTLFASFDGVDPFTPFCVNSTEVTYDEITQTLQNTHWRIAKYTDEAAAVIGQYSWGTNAIMLDDGSLVWTAYNGSAANCTPRVLLEFPMSCVCNCDGICQQGDCQCSEMYLYDPECDGRTMPTTGATVLLAMLLLCFFCIFIVTGLAYYNRHPSYVVSPQSVFGDERNV